VHKGVGIVSMRKLCVVKNIKHSKNQKMIDEVKILWKVLSSVKLDVHKEKIGNTQKTKNKIF